MKLSDHFDSSEFACPCCGFFIYNETLIFVLECLRTHLGSRPVAINSGCRCKYHNVVVCGKRASKHLTGDAADITILGVPASLVADVLEEWFPDSCGIGRYYTFTHFDVRNKKARW